MGALALNAQLDSAAQTKANDMAARDYWSHNTPDGKTPWTFIAAAGYQYQTAGENLAYGFGTAGDTITGWMNSPEHRANILNSSYRDVGFGIVNIPSYQNSGPETLVVAMYASPAVTPAAASTQSPSKPPAATPAPAPAPAPAAPAPSPAALATTTPAPTTPSAATSHVATDSSPSAPSPEPPTRQVARLQLVADNTPLNFFAIGLIGVVGFLFLLLRHSLAWHRRLVRGERFILHHPALDVATVSLISLSIILGHTAGLIR
jgi:hypothetical protein